MKEKNSVSNMFENSLKNYFDFNLHINMVKPIKKTKISWENTVITHLYTL
jgi:hypothetical protein